MAMFDIKDRSPRSCDNKAKINVCIEEGGAVYISHLLGGKQIVVGNVPYCCGCHEFRADYGTIITMAPVAAPGYKVSVGRKVTFQMKDKDVSKNFVFKCLTC